MRQGVAFPLGTTGDEHRPDRVFGLPIPFYPQVRLGVCSPMRILGMLESHRPDLVHIATEGPLGWAALMACLTLGVPIASSFHTNFDHYLGHYGLGWLERGLLAYLRWFHNQTQVTLVPDAPGQRTSDHGWDLGQDAGRLAGLIARLKASGARVSLFMDPEPAASDLLRRFTRPAVPFNGRGARDPSPQGPKWDCGAPPSQDQGNPRAPGPRPTLPPPGCAPGIRAGRAW